MSSASTGRIHWRLDELLHANGTFSHKRLAEALAKDAAHPISRTQVGRLVASAPVNVPLALVGALCRVLRCTPNDLMGWEAANEMERRPNMTAMTRKARDAAANGCVPDVNLLPETAPRLAEGDRHRIVGPSVRAMPTHPLARRGKPVE